MEIPRCSFGRPFRRDEEENRCQISWHRGKWFRISPTRPDPSKTRMTLEVSRSGLWKIPLTWRWCGPWSQSTPIAWGEVYMALSREWSMARRIRVRHRGFEIQRGSEVPDPRWSRLQHPSDPDQRQVLHGPAPDCRDSWLTRQGCGGHSEGQNARNVYNGVKSLQDKGMESMRRTTKSSRCSGQIPEAGHRVSGEDLCREEDRPEVDRRGSEVS